MKKELCTAAAVCAMMLISACASLYENDRTEEAFLAFRSATPAAHGVKTLEAVYETDQKPSLHLTVRMKEGGFLSLRYLDNEKSFASTVICHNGAAREIVAKSGEVHSAPETVSFFRFVCDMTFKGFDYVAERITMRESDPACGVQIFDMVCRPGYGIKSLVLHVRAKDHFLVRMEEPAVDGIGSVVLDFSEPKMYDGICMAQTIEMSGIYPEKVKVKLKQFRVNIPLDDALFKLPDIPVKKNVQINKQ